MSEPAPLYAARGIHRSFTIGEQTIRVLRGADLDVYPGEMVTIEGASGSGKSTLLHILGLLDRPDAGGLHFGGRDLCALSDRERAHHRRGPFGFVFQFYHLLPELTAAENIGLPGRMRCPGDGVPTARRRRDRVRELLEQVGLQDRASHRPGQLSGGERQRVAIARALYRRPRVVFCDEPTGNLDSETGARVWALLQKLAAEGSSSFVVVTHDSGLASQGRRHHVLADGVLQGG